MWHISFIKITLFPYLISLYEIFLKPCNLSFSTSINDFERYIYIIISAKELSKLFQLTEKLYFKIMYTKVLRMKCIYEVIGMY